MKARLLATLCLSLGGISPTLWAQASISFNPLHASTAQGLLQYVAEVPGHTGGNGVHSEPAGYSVQYTNPNQFTAGWSTPTSPLPGAEATGYATLFDLICNSYASIFGTMMTTTTGNNNTLSFHAEKHMEHWNYMSIWTGPEPQARPFLAKSWQDNGRGLQYVTPFTVDVGGTATVSAFDVNRDVTAIMPFFGPVFGYTHLSWRVDVDANQDGKWDGPQATNLGSGTLQVASDNQASSVGATFAVPPGSYTLRIFYDCGSEVLTYLGVQGPNSSAATAQRGYFDCDVNFTLTFN